MKHIDALHKTRIIANKRLMTNARFWELALGCRIDADSVLEIQGCTPK